MLKGIEGPLIVVSEEGSPLSRFTPLSNEPIRKQTFQYSIERKRGGGVRICARCLKAKPDRTHHCSVCNKCILRMDHHCPWVANCIGFANYKYFLNMLLYTALSSLLIACTFWETAFAAATSDQVPRLSLSE